MTRIVAVCNGEDKGTRKEIVAEGILSVDYDLVRDSATDVRERV